jgi:hypothetical protein
MSDLVYEHNYKRLMILLGNKTERRIEVAGHRPLCVEKTDGAPTIWMCHHGCKFGKPVRDPKVCFRLDGELARPVYYFNGIAGVKHTTDYSWLGERYVHTQLQSHVDGVVSVWFASLQAQGFFTKARELSGALKVAISTWDDIPAYSRHGEFIMAGVDYGELCSFDSGRFTARTIGRPNPVSHTYTYTANIGCGDTKLFDSLLKHELAGIERAASEGNEAWLTRWLFFRGVTNPVASGQDLEDFQCAVRASERLIGQFVQHGHRQVLKDPKMLQEVELEERQEAAQVIQVVTR